LAPVLVLRDTPLPWQWKRWIVWALSPRYSLGVYAVIPNADGAVLALRSAYSDRWQLPGGGVTYNESLEQAVRRECREEIGSEPPDLQMVALLGDSAGRGLHGVFRAGPLDAPVRLSEEHTAWRYAPSRQLSPYYRRLADRALTATSTIEVGAFDWSD